ncbi:MAG: 3-phosphoshikimate 1-carboxyvinyltransferase, partial [Clostridiales bacterium]|nr:3-phosphoshikimate 1-carboxyvinyltransferase [Clostridiales bacterium]
MKIFVPPQKKFSRILNAMPDKSITHRAFLFGSIAKGKTRITGALAADDCLHSLSCVQSLGATVTRDGEDYIVTGTDAFSSCTLDAGNSGTTMRLLCGLLAGKKGSWRIVGDESLSSRPMQRVIDPIKLMGGDVAGTSGKAPLVVTGSPLHGIAYTLPMASAQVKSAVLLAALCAEGETTVTEPQKSRDHTEIMLREMGANLTVGGNTVRMKGKEKLSGIHVSVAGDISSAAYPLVCALVVGGTATVRGVGVNPTRNGLLRIFDQIGAEYELQNEQTVNGEPRADICVRGLGKAKPFAIDAELMPLLIDEVPVLAVLASYLSGTSVIADADELRKKESDRIAATVNLIRSFGGEAEEEGSGFTVTGKPLKGGCTFSAGGAHRMAM